jgi:hypothetical protein
MRSVGYWKEERHDKSVRFSPHALQEDAMSEPMDAQIRNAMDQARAADRAKVVTQQVRYEGGWKSHHSIFLLSLHPIERDVLVDALPEDVLMAMVGAVEGDKTNE